ncbi:MAG: FAD-dependent oxidoreductase [Desulfobacterales bacterium]
MGAEVVIIGAGLAGIATALTARDVHPHKSICMVRPMEDGLNLHAIPYLLHPSADPSRGVLSTQPLEANGVQTLAGSVVALIPQDRRVILDSGRELAYERLVLATGTQALRPNIPGINRQGIYTLPRGLSEVAALRAELGNARNVVIVGGDYTGVALAEQVAAYESPQVHLIESQPFLLDGLFDPEFQAEIRGDLEQQGIAVHTDTQVATFQGTQQVEGVCLYGGQNIPADVVLLNLGAKPATQLAEKARMRLAENGAIWVDEFMRSATPGIFAVGGCALKRDFFTRKAVPIWLPSVSADEACNAATNLYGIRALHQMRGTVAAFTTRIGAVTYASTGMTAAECAAEEFCHVTAVAEASDRYCGNLSGARLLKVKLVVACRSGVILGGQMSGSDAVAQLINIVTLAIQQKLNVRDLDTLQVATHPLLTPAPSLHPLINAAHQALAQLRSGTLVGF